MNRKLLCLLVSSMIGLSALPGLASSCCPEKTPAKATKPAKPAKPARVISAVCPVMGTNIPDITKAAGKSVYKGKTYYFCCGGCKPLFDKNPEKYIKKAGKK